MPGAGGVAGIGASGTYTVTVSTDQSVFGISSVTGATLDVSGNLTISGSGTSVLSGHVQNDSSIHLAGGTVEFAGGLTNSERFTSMHRPQPAMAPSMAD